ncbi:VOC family protein [Thalassobacillus sp. CUG 92003]|uniref:VOC family protein n=1 Tax=Thalassobacillus sp. CUG 92003 TaxID=2736641 RepID=UPI0015E6E147|nr:VOC family protein [Thalassobacillus sp. CUG 92003]
MPEYELQGVGQIGIPVTDITRAISFYRDVLNLPLLFHTERMAFFACGGIRLLLSLPEKTEFEHQSSIVYFQVADINRVHQELLEQNVHFLDKPHLVAEREQIETWMTFFKDSEQNTHALMSEVSV